jgi:hypothetical protein
MLSFLFSLCVILTINPLSVFAWDDIDKIPSCPFCGMDRDKFAHSRVYIPYEDGSAFGGCSIHCAAIELSLHIDKTPLSIQVGDYESKTLIDAERAFWVIGGNLSGVMTRRAKWAFKSKSAADNFIRQYGGKHADFDQVMKATYEDMHTDIKMIREKRKRMRSMKNVDN